MAALPDSNTARFKFHYTSTSTAHTLQLRSNVSPAVAGLVFDNLFNALSPELFATTLDFVEWAPAASDVFNPVVTGYEGSTYGVGGALPYQVGQFYGFIGRSAGGRRNRFAVFGAKQLGVNFRFQPSENINIDAALATLVGSAANILAIDGLATVFKSYVNAGVNVHYQKAVRS